MSKGGQDHDRVIQRQLNQARESSGTLNRQLWSDVGCPSVHVLLLSVD